MLRVWGAERGEAAPGWAGGAGPGKAAPGLELDAYLQVTTAERFTPYLSAIQPWVRGARGRLWWGYGDERVVGDAVPPIPRKQRKSGRGSGSEAIPASYAISQTHDQWIEGSISLFWPLGKAGKRRLALSCRQNCPALEENKSVENHASHHSPAEKS